MSLINELKMQVENHPVLKSQWLMERKKQLTKKDLILWLCQEYFVSVEFVNWFLWTASLTNDVNAKIILVQNIWEELGGGNANKSHVKILIQFLKKIGIDENEIVLLEHTKVYLQKMKELTSNNFYEALGALGPANEYLLKMEYGQMYNAYKELRKKENLPESTFFEVNLEADESHSEVLFRLIELICDTSDKSNKVKEGNQKALEARLLFYEGLKNEYNV